MSHPRHGTIETKWLAIAGSLALCALLLATYLLTRSTPPAEAPPPPPTIAVVETAPTTDPPLPAPDPDEPVLSTEDFGRGGLTMEKAPARSLETFLQDLNRRKDYDASQHDGHPGPDAPFLSSWIDQVMAELQSRGYRMDPDGKLHRPDGQLVAVR